MISIDSTGTSAASAAAPPAADGLGPSVDTDLAAVERDLSQWFDSASGWLDQHPLASHLIGLLVLFAAAATVMLLVRLVLGPILKRVVDRYGHAALPHLINHRTIAAAGWVVAALVVWGLGPNLDWISEGARRLVVNIAGAGSSTTRAARPPSSARSPASCSSLSFWCGSWAASSRSR